MDYTCHHCEQATGEKEAHSITLYQEDGTEDRLEVLCDDCYADWLEEWKG